MGIADSWITRQFMPFLTLPALLTMSAIATSATLHASTLAPLTLVVAAFTVIPLTLGFAIDAAAITDPTVNPATAFWLLIAGTVTGLLGAMHIVGLHITAGGGAAGAGLAYLAMTLSLVLLGVAKDRASIAYVALTLTALASIADGVHWPILLACGLLGYGISRGWDLLRRIERRIPILGHLVITRRRHHDPAASQPMPVAA